MTFEAREYFFGFPVSQRRQVPLTDASSEYEGSGGAFGVQSGKILKVTVDTQVSGEDGALAVSSRTRVADSWRTFREDFCVQNVHPGSSDRARVFLPTPGHYLLFRDRKAKTK